MYRNKEILNVIVWWPNDAQHMRAYIRCDDDLVERLRQFCYETSRFGKYGPIAEQMEEAAKKSGATPLDEFVKWYESYDVTPAITRLEEFCDDFSDDETALALTKLTEWNLGHHPYGNQLAETIPGTVLNIQAGNVRKNAESKLN